MSVSNNTMSVSNKSFVGIQCEYYDSGEIKSKVFVEFVEFVGIHRTYYKTE